jgi:ArsR family transcriptional regulator, arsenate/arsenite/antimonite-responsive transcriptional repressor
MHIMEITKIYKCLCDTQRLRILNLLKEGPLCVCHIMEILGIDQVKASKQLRYMKELGLVTAYREAQWMVYKLSDEKNPLLVENLKCLQDCAGEELSFSTDLQQRTQLLNKIQSEDCACPGEVLCC